MNPDDFSQFDDPRVREVMAAAANLVEYVAEYVELFAKHGKVPITIRLMGEEAAKVTTVLFAAQHSRPKADAEASVHKEGHLIAAFPLACDKPKTHEKPIKFDKWGYGMAETNQFLVDGSKPGGKAFIAAVEEFDSVTGKDARGYTADDYNGRGGPGDR